MNEIEISVLSPGQLDRVKPLLRRSPFKPHRFLAGEIEEELAELWWHELAEPFTGDSLGAFVARDAAGIVGLIICARLPWESRVLDAPIGGLKQFVVDPASSHPAEVAEALLASILGWARAEGMPCLTCKVCADDMICIHALERAGFLLVDSVLDCVYDVRSHPLASIARPALPGNATIREATGADVDELVSVARAAFEGHFGRFHADPRLPLSKAQKVYEEWMRSSCAGYADWVLVAEVGGRLAGCTIWKKPSAHEAALSVRVGHYSIGLVHPDFSGRGLFSALTFSGMKLLTDVAECIEGPTHVNNIAVQRGYVRLSWRFCGARHSFHKWFDERPPNRSLSQYA